MAINDDVFRSILAMDSYNRGYDAGITLTDNGLGTATLTLNANDATAQAASFFAQSYEWNGETVSSFRGPTRLQVASSGQAKAEGRGRQSGKTFRTKLSKKP